MTVKLLTEHLSFLAEQEASQAGPSLHLSKCHIVGNHVSRLKSSFRHITCATMSGPIALTAYKFIIISDVTDSMPVGSIIPALFTIMFSPLSPTIPWTTDADF